MCSRERNAHKKGDVEHMAEPARKLTPEEVAHSIIQMTPGELETLEILLDKEFSTELLKSWKSKKIISFEEIVGRKPCRK